MNDKLTLSLVCNKKILIKIFELISEELTHISTPVVDTIFYGLHFEDIIDEGHLKKTHEYIHDRCSSNLFWAIEEFTANFNE